MNFLVTDFTQQMKKSSHPKVSHGKAVMKISHKAESFCSYKVSGRRVQLYHYLKMIKWLTKQTNPRQANA